MQPVNQLSQTTQQAQAAAGSMSRIQELLDEPPGIADRPGAVALERLADEITLDAVTLAYGPGRPALDTVSLKIPIGSHVAFVGPSGAGKTSLLNLLLRFWDPTAGRVLLDGHDMRDLTVASLRRQFGVILQDTFVFNTTVRANIAFGRPDATDEQVVAAAEAARLHDFIAALPAGYETVLGDRGVRMSGGQRQRLAIARALLRDPAVLILDEATSALDARTEAELRRSLADAGEGRTVVSISHRLTSIVVLGPDLRARGRAARRAGHARGAARDGRAVPPALDRAAGRRADRGAARRRPGNALAAVPLLAHVPPPVLRGARERRNARALRRRRPRSAATTTPARAAARGPRGRARVRPRGTRQRRRRPAVRARATSSASCRSCASSRCRRRCGRSRRCACSRSSARTSSPSPGTSPELQRAVLGQLARRRAAFDSAASASDAYDDAATAEMRRRRTRREAPVDQAALAADVDGDRDRGVRGHPDRRTGAVLLLASTDTVTAEAPVVRPGSNDALRPSAPFFANAGDGVRPDGVGCTGPGRVAVRGRAHLDVFADGRRVTVPGGIGVQPTCAYWLRTTRTTGSSRSSRRSGARSRSATCSTSGARR